MCPHGPPARQNATVMERFHRLRERKEWQFFAVLPKAAPGLAAAWWIALILRGTLPAAFAIAMGVLVGAVQGGHPLSGHVDVSRRTQVLKPLEDLQRTLRS